MKNFKNLSLTAVRTLAKKLAKQYASKNVVIGLVGPLGAGKTTFTKSFLGYFGIKNVKSPSFIVSQVYTANSKKLYHFDFYRLENKRQLAPLEFFEILGSSNRILLIEWADKFPEIQKKCDLVLNFEISNNNKRHVSIV